MRRFSLLCRVLALGSVFAGSTSCASDTAVSPAVVASANGLLPPLFGGSTQPSLLACDPPPAPLTMTGLVGPLGGILQLGNTRVVIPRNAVPGPTNFTLTIPASRLVEISVHAGDAEHYLFALPVIVSIDYGRCADAVPLLKPLSVWHIDESSKSLLENMSGVDLRPLHIMTFFTGHLSGYAVAD